MPDFRLDAVTDAIEELSVDWLALAIAAKSAGTPRETADLLTAGVIGLQAQTNSINAQLFGLAIKDIAIDLHTGAS